MPAKSHAIDWLNVNVSHTPATTDDVESVLGPKMTVIEFEGTKALLSVDEVVM